MLVERAVRRADVSAFSRQVASGSAIATPRSWMSVLTFPWRADTSRRPDRQLTDGSRAVADKVHLPLFFHPTLKLAFAEHFGAL